MSVRSLLPCWRPLLQALPVVILAITSSLFIPTAFAFTTTLITFDVDGTLVKGSGQQADSSAHAKAFSYACGVVLGDGKTPVKPVAEALPQHLYHGSTDGLILCRLAKAELGLDNVSQEQLSQLFRVMYEYVAALDDEQVAKGIETLPGVLNHLETLQGMQSTVRCGLVTGNVEGIARRKMKAVGVLQTGALAGLSPEQLEANNLWPGSENIGFLGGFGSDFCSRNIVDLDRNFLDRGEQIAIATKRCQSTLLAEGTNLPPLRRVVHVGDAPSDVLAAKSFAEKLMATPQDEGDDLCIGLVGVATGSYDAETLRKAAGEPIPGRWEPVILEQGMADPAFLGACGVL